ncbi:MAG TPA: IS21 family transposase, partial [Arenibacter sp.]|nr:IS21 family transposase [Arenibacter sp.]
MNYYLNKFMTYYEIRRMSLEGHSVSQISNHLVLNWRTVKKYLSMNEQDYEEFLIKGSRKKKLLAPYEDFVRAKLEVYRDTPAAQMHDWLKEYDAGFPKVSPKTVFNFMQWVRTEHDLPHIPLYRQYEMVDELPYGKQAQVDFGEYNMRSSTGYRVKVFFFCLILSRSRFKYVWFTDKYFTSELAIMAHEKAFEYIGGVPDEIVYDQDKVFIVSENGGDIILTEGFRSYTRDQSFTLHFCRRADPQSKGKVENVVKYVKQNFLYNRTYHNIETLNDEVLGWLGRTANMMPHGITKKEPFREKTIEQAFLKPYVPQTIRPTPVTYAVRKDNTISYRGNFYSLPLGTFKGKSTQVGVHVKDTLLIIADREDDKEICRHQIPAGKGNKVLNNDHKRDKSEAIKEMLEQVAILFQDREKALQWLQMIRSDKPRYIRDQLLIIKNAIKEKEPQQVERALDYCIGHSI